MLKQLLIIALLIAGLWLFRRLKRQLSGRTRKARSSDISFRETVRCGRCGVHVLRSEAVGDPFEGYFCSDTHRLAARKASDTDKT